MEQLIRAFLQTVEAAGLPAMQAHPATRHPHLKGPAVAVSVKEATGLDGAMARYLGTVEDAELGERALYGLRLQAQVELTALSPRDDSAAACDTVLEQLQAVVLGGIGGISVQGFSCGRSSYDPTIDCFRGTMTVQCIAWLYATAQEEDGAVFENFILKGEIA